MTVKSKLHLFFIVFLGIARGSLFAQNYTKCSIENSNSDEHCIPDNDDSLSFQFQRSNASDPIVAVIPYKNCRQKTNSLMGSLSLVIDSSQSTKTTDPNNFRREVANSFLDDSHTRALQNPDPTDPLMVGVVVYGGRTLTLLQNEWEADGLNQKYTINPCVALDQKNPTWPSDDAKSSWTKKIGNFLVSVCEFMSPVEASIKTASLPETPSVERMKDFISFTTEVPRGATDMRQFFEAIANQNMLGTTSSRAKNAIVVTDGLPNVPLKVDEATCKSSFWLKDEPLQVAEDGPKKGQKYCYDRKFRQARESADRLVETDARFKEINVYHALFTDQQNSFDDTDDKGSQRPDDFLIENSARTGNGKVKFKYARNRNDLSSFFSEMFEYQDAAALQWVEVQVNDNTSYHAVSSSKFGVPFSIKLINLKSGDNQVKVKFVFSDKIVNSTLSVNVGNSISNSYTCKTENGTNVTVDGDPITAKDPKGDGVLPFPKLGTQDRVYRNSSADTKYSDADFEKGVDPKNIPVVTDPLKKLRIQGGTGNCGYLGGKGFRRSAVLFWVVLFPVFLLLFRRFKIMKLCALIQKRGIGFLLLGISVYQLLGCFRESSALAGGLNSEGFYPAIDNKSGVMIETPIARSHGSLLYGYTFSYALRPVEFGDGDSERKSVSDHIQVNHLAVSYAFTPYIDFGVNLPFVMYAAPKSNGGYLESVGSDRKFFFLSDAKIRAKFLAFPGKIGDGFRVALLGSVRVPTGNRAVLMSDGALRGDLEIPMSFSTGNERLTYYFTPGVSFWSKKERVNVRDRNTGERTVLLEKSRSLLTSIGARFWLIHNNAKAGSTQLEANLRGDFENFRPSLSGKASPVEWSGGGLFFLSDSLSLHGAYGTGIGGGVTAPLSRLTAGLRYEDVASASPRVYKLEPKKTSGSDGIQTLEETPSSSAFSDLELDKILREAEAEKVPPSVGENDSILRLKTETEILDIGLITFEFNSATLTPVAKQTVKLLFDRLKALKVEQVSMEGHTDSVGSYKYNLALSKRRAESVKAELVRLGLPSEIITTEGFAFKYPIESNATKKGRAANRRLDVSINNQGFEHPTSGPELEKLKSLIYPGGKQPTKNQEK